MSEQNEVTIVDQLSVVSKLEIGNSDLVNIAVAEHELKLLKEEEVLEAKYRQLQKDLSSATDTFTKLLTDSAVEAGEEKAKKVAASFKVFDKAVSYKITAGQYKTQSSKISSSISFYSKDNSISFQVFIEHAVTDEVKAAFEKIGAKQSEISDCAEQRIQNKRNLSRLSTIERQAKAQVAKAALSQSERGKKILDEIGSIAGLPKALEVKN